MISISMDYFLLFDTMEGSDILYRIFSKNISLKAIIFIDANIYDSQKMIDDLPFSKLLLNSRRFHIIFDYSQTECLKYPTKWREYRSISNIILRNRIRDSKLGEMTEQMKYLHQRLHEDIVFFIVSNNVNFWKTIYELRDQGRAIYMIDSELKFKELLKRSMKFVLSELKY